MEEIYQEYRERLIKNNVSNLELEIFDIFIRKEFVEDTLKFVELLQNKDYKGLLKELKAIEKSLYNIKDNKYSRNERLAYSNITRGYVIRLQRIVNKEEETKYDLIEQGEQLLKQSDVDIELYNNWIKKYKKHIIENHKKNSREYDLLTICNLSIESKLGDNVEINKMLLRMSVEFGIKILSSYV